MKKIHSILCIALLTSACTVGPDYIKPQTDAEDSVWSGAPLVTEKVAHSVYIETAWWKALNDPLLNALMEETANHNHDVAIARASIEEARALRQVSASAFFPSVGAGTNVLREGLSQKSGNNRSSERERNGFDADLDVSWELDMFGRTRRATEAADARIDAQVEEYHDIMLTVLAELARNYFEVRGTQKRIAVTQRNIGLLKEVESLAESLFKNGATSEFDVARARGEREINEATLPNLEAEMMAGIYRISVLTGKAPEHHMVQLGNTKPLPTPPDIVPVGLRSEVLKRRPDVRRAEREVAAATADIGVATAELFPSISLTGAVGSSARQFSDLFTSGAVTYALGQTMNWRLFEGGKLRGNIAVADARATQSLKQYEKTVLTALEDAESSLVRYGKEWNTLKALKAAESTRQEAFRIAKLRYEEGEENFLIILDAERSLIDTQDAIIQSETQILTKLTQLYKALGGGWQAFK